MTRSTYQIGAEIISALMIGDQTWSEVERTVGIGTQTSEAWKAALRAEGVLRVAYIRPGSGRPQVLELQPPFARPDNFNPQEETSGA